MNDTVREESPGWTGATGAPTRILLARHGQTPLSVDRRYSGRGDADLTEIGREQGRLTAERLAGHADLAAVVSSPLQRARATAEAVAETAGVPLRIDESFVETDFGSWEGLTFSEAAQRDPELHRSWIGDTAVRPPEGESFAVVRARVEGGLRDLTERHAGQTVVIVSHVTPIKLALRAALDASDTLLFRLHLDLGSVSEIRFYPDGNASVHLVNDTSHLS